MNKQRLVSIGSVVFFLFLAMTSLLEVENPKGSSSNQPAPVSAPAAISAPARTAPAPASATPIPAHNQQPAIRPIPQPIPTPARVSAVNGTPSTQNPLPMLLLVLLVLGVFGLIVRVALRLSWQRNSNGRSAYQPVLAKGAQS